MSLLSGKVALVTGAASGIGKAIAKIYAQNGAKVVVSDIDPIAGEQLVTQLVSEGAEAVFIKADTAIAQDVEQLVEKTVQAFGRLDIACNNAGIGGEMNMAGDLSLEGWKKVIDINLNGVFYGTKYQINQMLKTGGGAIINMGSIHSITGVLGSSAYAAAKHGVLGLTRTAGSEYGKQNIRINAVGPGYIDTPLLDALDAETKAALVQKHPVGRLGRAEEVAQLVLFLSSDLASNINAGYYAIDGGYTAL